MNAGIPSGRNAALVLFSASYRSSNRTSCGDRFRSALRSRRMFLLVDSRGMGPDSGLIANDEVFLHVDCVCYRTTLPGAFDEDL